MNDCQLLKVTGLELGDLCKETAIDAGVHSFASRVTLRLTGSVEQHEPQLYTPTVDLPLLSILALVAQRAGLKGQALCDEIVQAAHAALEAGEEEAVSDWLEHTKAAMRQIKAELLAKLPKKQRAGRLVRACRLDVVSVLPIKPRKAA